MALFRCPEVREGRTLNASAESAVGPGLVFSLIEHEHQATAHSEHGFNLVPAPVRG